MNRKMMAIAAVCLVLLLCGCQKSMNSIIKNEPSITGNVIEVYENSILMEDEASNQYYVSLDVQNSDSYTDVVQGDEIA